MKNQEIKAIVPRQSVGWLESKLSQECIDILWRYVEKSQTKNNDSNQEFNNRLAGNISSSLILNDDGNWFFNNALKNLCEVYAKEFRNEGNLQGVSDYHDYTLKTFWVNFQKENQFNPPHSHSGVYSFVVWLKIPTDWREQHKIDFISKSNSPSASNFSFLYTNILGEQDCANYRLDQSHEGTILFFPSKLTHTVYPFYNCKEERISISGNIALNTSNTASPPSS